LTGSNNGQETISTRKTRYQQRSKKMMKRHKLAAHILFLLVLLNCIALLFIFAWIILLKPPKTPQTPPSEVFRQYVLDPIPASVTNIRADQPKNFGGYRYTFRFNINRDDLALLIDLGPLVRVWNVKYKNGCLFWAWDTWRGFSMGGVTITVYGSSGWRREPRWFRPELWDNPEAYAFDETVGGRMNTKVLLYNEKEGEAYFVVDSWEE
jgi:hypothetical protein